MAVGKPRCGSYPVYVYDPVVKRKRYVGSFASLEDARAAETETKARIASGVTRICPGCRKRFRPMDDAQRRCSHRCDLMVKSRERRKAHRREDDHWVYTCVDAAGEIIYVGVTSTGLRRHREHGRGSGWWTEVATIRVEHFPTRVEALAVEAERIERLNPDYNTIVKADDGITLG